MLQILWIPNYVPASLNDFVSAHFMVAKKIKDEAKELVGHYARIQNLHTAETRRRVDMRVCLGKGEKMRDEDNLWKAILDAFVFHKLLKNDSARWFKKGEVIQYKDKIEYTRESFFLFEDIL